MRLYHTELVVNMDMVRPWKDPWGLSPGLRPWEAWAVLTDLCGGSVYATATVVVTVAADTQWAWYGLTGPLDAGQLPPGPGT